MKLLIILIGLFTLTSANSQFMNTSDTYDVSGFYELVELESGSKAMDSYNNIEDAESVLIPTKLDQGKYEVELTKLDSNFYQVYGTDVVIETRYCMEWATRDDAILIVESNYGYTKGEVIFLE